MQRTLVLFALAATTAGLTRTAAAQGFQVNEHGTCVMARGGTGVAKPCADGSAMFFNPAGIVGTRNGWTVSAGVTVIDAYGGFTDDLTESTADLQNGPIPVPHLYVQYQKDKLAGGLGVFVPYGLGTKWDASFDGAFAGYDNNLQNIYIQPTVAYRPHPMVTIGAGFDVVVGKVKLTQLADLSEVELPPEAGLPAGTTFGMLGVAPRTPFANADLNGHGTGFGGHFGITVQPHDRIRLGARYLMKVEMDYEGDVDFSPYPTGVVLPAPLTIAGQTLPAGTPLDLIVASSFTDGPLVDQNVTAAATMPDQFTAGIAIDVTPTLTVLADYNWVHWSLFENLPVNFDTTSLSSVTVENYVNTNGVRVGLDWAATPKLAVRGGFIWHTAAAPPETVTPLLPEGERNEFTGGIGYAFSDMFEVNAAYQYLNQQKRRGRTGEFPSGGQPTLELNDGVYEFKAHLFGLTLTARF
jgi:long-chain fatty acid transport protein